MQKSIFLLLLFIVGWHEPACAQYRVDWEYDHLERIVKQEEDGKAATFFIYDEKGRLVKKILPSKLVITLSYDEFDHLIEMKSSDREIHYQYCYSNEFVRIFDLLQGTAIEQIYDRSGNLLRESNDLFTLQWTYNDMGRRSSFTLPDGSSIQYDLNIVKRNSYEYKYFDDILTTQSDELGRVVLQTSPWHRLAVSYNQSNLVEKIQSSLFHEKEYSYDALNQLVRDGKTEYAFDALGNPAHCQIGACNRITATPECRLVYDADGNPTEKIYADETIYYRYDALGRLTEIERQGKKTRYFYDPLSRLKAKETNGEKIYYLYDQQEEIGTLDEKGNLLELKVIAAGKAVAIEIGGKVFTPLHDLFGSIIALIGEDGSIVEKYDLDAFGKQALAPALCPWRFCSKRTDEDLIFFGRRFYDPSLLRWLTPDPAGFIDGANLYAFMRNSPLNRYDLYGLLSLPFRIELPIATISDQLGVLHCKGTIDETAVDWAVSCGFLQQLQLTPEELKAGVIDLAEHLSDLTPPEGRALGILTYQNGIKTTFSEFTDSCQSIADKVPEGTLLIGLHNKTKGFAHDIHRLIKEIVYIDTPIVSKTRHFMGTLGAALDEINSQLLWGHILHSEGGAIARRAIEGMSPEHRDYLRQHLCIYALGPVLPIPIDFAYRVLNVYSKQDFLGIGSYLLGIGGYSLASTLYGAKNCNIRFIPSTSKWYEKFLFLVDHAILHGTYGQALDDQIKKWREMYNFYEGNINNL